MRRIIQLRDIQTRPALTEYLRIAMDRQGREQRIEAHAERMVTLGLTSAAAGVLRRDGKGNVTKFADATQAAAASAGVSARKLSKRLAKRRRGWQRFGQFEFRADYRTARPKANGCDSPASKSRTGNGSHHGRNVRQRASHSEKQAAALADELAEKSKRERSAKGNEARWGAPEDKPESSEDTVSPKEKKQRVRANVSKRAGVSERKVKDAAKAKANQKASGGPVPQKSAEPVETRKEVAKLAGVSHDTIAKPAKDAARAQMTLTVTPAVPYDDGVGGEGPPAFTRWNHATAGFPTGARSLLWRAAMNVDTPESPYLTKPELARRWSCGGRTIARRIADGSLSILRIGKLVRIPMSEIERFESANIQRKTPAETPRRRRRMKLAPETAAA